MRNGAAGWGLRFDMKWTYVEFDLTRDASTLRRRYLFDMIEIDRSSCENTKPSLATHTIRGTHCPITIHAKQSGTFPGLEQKYVVTKSFSSFIKVAKFRRLTEKGITKANRHRFRLQVVVEGRLTQFTANAGLLVTAEGQLPAENG